jgi:molecular chaperone DnaK
MENLQKLGAELYAAAQAAGAGAAPNSDAGPGPEASAGGASASGKKAEKKADVVDADFEVVDDDKNKKG